MTTSSLTMDMAIAKIGVNYLKTAKQASQLGYFSGFRFGSLNTLTVDELATNVAGAVTYFGVAGEMSYSRINKYEVILRAVIDHNKGDFDIGSFAITAGPSNIPFFIGKFPYIHKKMATRDTKLGGRFTLQLKFKMYDMEQYWSFANLTESYTEADNSQINYENIPDTFVESPGYLIQIDEPPSPSGRGGYLLYGGRKGLSWRSQDLHMKHTDGRFFQLDGGIDGDGHLVSNDGWYSTSKYQAHDVADSVVKYPCAIADFRDQLYAMTPAALGTLQSAPAANLQGVSATLDRIFEYTRASGPATYLDGEGKLRNALAGVPRWDYTNGVSQLLLESAASNYVASSEMNGWVAGKRYYNGTGDVGVFPTNWTMDFGGGSTGWVELLSVVTDSKNRRRLRLQFNIVNGTGSTQNPRLQLCDVPGVAGELWSGQAFFNVISTSHTITAYVEANSSAVTLLSAALTTGEQNVRMNNGLFPGTGQTTCRLKFGVTLPTSATWTAIVEIAMPQLEKSACCSSYIPTTGTVLTRAADNMRFSTKMRSLLQRSSLTVIVKGQGFSGVSGSLIGTTSNNVVGLNAGQTALVMPSLNVKTSLTVPLPNLGVGVTWTGSDKKSSYNGEAVQSNPTGLGFTLTDSYLGRGSGYASGWYNEIIVYPYRLTNADLMAKSVIF